MKFLKEHKKLVCLILMLTLLFSNISLSFSSSPEDAGLIMPSEIKKTNNKYLNEYKNNYYLDMVKYNIIKNPEGSINNIANVLFSAQKTLGYFLVVLFYYSFEFDLFEIFEGEITLIQKNLKESIFDEFSIMAISLLGLFFVVKVIKDQKTQVWVAIIQILMIIVFATYFMLRPVDVLKGMDNISKEVSGQVLAGTYKASGQGSPESAVISATNDIWQVFVHTPWQILEFGDLSKAKHYEDDILTLTPESSSRKSLIKDISDDEYFTTDWGMKRVGFMLLYSIPLMVKAFLIIALCLLQIAYQFLTIFFSILAPFVFLIALIPFFGIKIVQNWLMKILSFQGVRIVVSLTIAVVCVFDSTLFALSKDYGWFIILALQLIISLILFFKYEVFIDLFTKLRVATTSPQVINREMRKDSNIENSLRKGHLKDITQTNSNAYESTIRKTSKAKGKVKGGVARTTQGAKNIKDKLGTKASAGLNNYETKNKEKQNFRNLMVEAESILGQQYEFQKEGAEKKAQKFGKEVEYPDFVRKVQTRESLGVSRFEEREVIAVANELKKIKGLGGNSKDLIKDKANINQNIKRPKNINMDHEKDSNKLNDNQKIKMREDKKGYAKEYVEEFNQKYKKDYKPVFMENLIEKHGRENVRSSLDTMDRISNKKDIQNPAGYLLTTLKNKEEEQIRPKNINQGEHNSKDNINVNNTNMLHERYVIEGEENQEKIIQKLDFLEKQSKKEKTQVSGETKVENMKPQNLETGNIKNVKDDMNLGIKRPIMATHHEFIEGEERHTEVTERLDKIQKDIKKDPNENNELNKTNNEFGNTEKTGSNEVIRPVNLNQMKEYLGQDGIKNNKNIKVNDQKMRVKGNKE